MSTKNPISKSTIVAHFVLTGLFWGAIMYVSTSQPKLWLLLSSSIFYSGMMTWMMWQMSKSDQLYLKPNQTEELIQYLLSLEYVIKKKNKDHLYFKKENKLSWIFNEIYIKSSSFYTLIRAPRHVIDNVPDHIPRK